MGKPALLLPSRRKGTSPRRAKRFALRCESLESRQLLSVGQGGFVASAILNSAVTAAQISASPVVSNQSSASTSVIEINYGSFSGISQIQIVFLGSTSAFSPSFGGGSSSFAQASSASASPSLGSNVGLGTLSGTSSGSSSSNSGTTGSVLSSGSALNTVSITPLNTSATSSTNTTAGQVVYVVPPPILPPAVHLGASTAPATSQSNSTLLSNIDEQPPITRFGQGDVFDNRRMPSADIELKPVTSSFLDFIDPHREVAAPAPVEAPKAAPAAAPQADANDAVLAPDDAKVRLVPAISDPKVDAALDMTDSRVLTRSRDADSTDSQTENLSTDTSWSFSAIFGAAAIAAGGYHLAMRESDRFRGRWIPRWVGAERPTKKKVR